MAGVWVHALADADGRCGGKADGLARLLAAHLPVPDGIALETRVVSGSGRDELPVELLGELVAWAKRVGGPFAIRSSAALEDTSHGAAAGVFASVLDVPLDGVPDAVRTVLASATSQHAVAYAARRHMRPEIAMGVIVQRYVRGTPIRAYTRPPGEPSTDQLIVQTGASARRVSRTSDDPIAILALRAESAIDATTTGADVELVKPEGGSVMIVQARSIVHPVAHAALAPPPRFVLEPLDDGRPWTWDIAHNPDPLSPAQQGLVERVERARLGAYELRLVAGYLYTTPRPGVSGGLLLDDAALLQRATELEARIEAALDEVRPPKDVAEALDRYTAFYRIWAGELAPIIAAARAARPTSGARPSAIEATLLAGARDELSEQDVIARLGFQSPAWDVASPTFGEQPELIRSAIMRARAIAAKPEGGLAIDVAADLAERDDAWFARAQRLVRRALLVRARELALHDDDIFWLPLQEVADGHVFERDTAHRQANAASAAQARAANWQMPRVVGGASSSPPQTLIGVGTGSVVSGRVVRLRSLASVIAVCHGDVVVTRAITPALAVLVVGCAAVVSESGSLLDHGAALCRELAITCVVGCANAWSELSDGAFVVVDGQGGVVTRV